MKDLSFALGAGAGLVAFAELEASLDFGAAVDGASGDSFLFAFGAGEVGASEGVVWAQTKPVKQRPAQAIAVTAKSEINLSIVFIEFVLVGISG